MLQKQQRLHKCSACLSTKISKRKSRNYRKERRGKKEKCQLALQGSRKTMTHTYALHGLSKTLASSATQEHPEQTLPGEQESEKGEAGRGQTAAQEHKQTRHCPGSQSHRRQSCECTTPLLAGAASSLGDKQKSQMPKRQPPCCRQQRTKNLIRPYNAS